MAEDTSEITDRIRDFRTWGFDARGWSESTRYAYGRRVKYADAWLRDHRDTTAVDADEDDVRAWLASLPANARTRNHSRAALKGWHAYLVARGLRSYNPVDEIDPLRVSRLVPKAHTSEEAAAIWCEAEADGPRAAAAVALFLYAGLRRTEVQQLEWTDIEGDFVRFHGKGGHERVVPLHEDAVAALDRWREDCVSLRWVFPSPRNDGPLSGSWLYLEVKRVARQAGVRTHPHKLRHTYATELLENGVDVRVVQELLGHASLATTQVYTMVRPSRLREAVGRLGYGAAS